MSRNTADRKDDKTFAGSLERLLGRLVNGGVGLAKDALVASLLVPAVGGFSGCTDREIPYEPIQSKEAALSDWVHNEGQPNTDMVQYTGAFWTQGTECGGRGGCMALNVYLKLKVKRVDGANLDQKKVGVYCAGPFCDSNNGVTATGYYFGDLGEGWEEWHVALNRRMWDTAVVTFTAWYQDGKGNTFFDDNSGELHAAAYKGAPTVIHHDWAGTDVTVTDDGVKGKVTMVLAALDFDKDVRMIWTIDGWKTSSEFKMGESGKTNEFYFVDSGVVGYGLERWALDLDIVGQTKRFEYAVLYRHGAVNGAKQYDFWDNNAGMNHMYVKGAYTLPYGASGPGY